MVAEDAGAAPQPKTILDGKLGAAVAAVESSAKAPSAGASGQNGPPESGVFSAAGADAALPAGAPAKIEVLGEGSEPRVLLSMAPKGDEQKAVISVSVQIQQIGMALDVGLTLKLDKPKGDKGDKGDKADKSESAGPLKVVAGVTSVAPAKEVSGQVPKEMSEAFSKLKGSEIRYQMAPSGAISDISTTMSKDVDKSSPVFPLVEVMLRGAGEALSMLSVVVPPKPVGVGGYWMVTERSPLFPVEVLRYRVFKVDKIDKDHASMTVDVRQYATKGEADLGTIAKGQKLPIDAFEAQGKGIGEWSAGTLLAPGCEAKIGTQAMSGGGAGGGKGPGAQQKAMVQMEIRARSSQAEKSDKKK